MRYRLACFDLDGTLLDTLGGLTQSLNAARRMNNLEPQTEEQVQSFIGNGKVRLIERSLTADPGSYSEELKQKLLKDNADYYNSHYLERTRPYNGITEVASASAATSSWSRSRAIFCGESAKIAGIETLFDYVRGSVEGVERKPSAEPVEKCLMKLGINNSEAVYIGDSDTDIRTAQNSGLDIISCTWGYRSREFLIENGAESICSDPMDLRSFMR